MGKNNHKVLGLTIVVLLVAMLGSTQVSRNEVTGMQVNPGPFAPPGPVPGPGISLTPSRPPITINTPMPDPLNEEAACDEPLISLTQAEVNAIIN